MFLTARPPRSVVPIAEQAGVTGTMICSNGAIVYDLATHRLTASYALDPATIRKLTAALAEAVPGVAFAAETGRRVLVEGGYTWPDVHDAAFIQEVPDICDEDQPFVKLLAVSTEHTADDMLAMALPVVEGHAEITHTGVHGLVEISAPGVTKAGTFALLCQELGVDPAEVVAFGDMPNDLAVLTFAGTGYAMANAHQLVLAAIERRTLSNDEDGVAVVLERLFS
ncbi:HAD hydrolase family protein [Microbispora rosea]|uniref:HAD hydrolase family protein n=1 Tax=Microbispora rosea TaxID=58117 RepID=UPI000AF49942|nr:HAD hydrolase family protein [Microbispora rosea]